jgi:hypothetical protein
MAGQGFVRGFSENLRQHQRFAHVVSSASMGLVHGVDSQQWGTGTPIRQVAPSLHTSHLAGALMDKDFSPPEQTGISKWPGNAGKAHTILDDGWRFELLLISYRTWDWRWLVFDPNYHFWEGLKLPASIYLVYHNSIMRQCKTQLGGTEEKRRIDSSHGATVLRSEQLYSCGEKLQAGHCYEQKWVTAKHVRFILR